MNDFSRREVGRLAIGTWLVGMMGALAPSALAQTATANAAKMEKRKLGSMSPSLTGIGLVTLGRTGYADAERTIHAALDNGINFFDTGQNYGDTPEGLFVSEDYLGRALAGRRDRAYIATKVGYADDRMPRRWLGLKAATLEEQVDRSLKKLRTDYIDIYQLHRASDPDTPIEETLGGLARLVEKGKVRHLGTSNGNADLLRAHDAAAKKLGVPRFIATQSGLSLLSRGATTRLLPTLMELDIGLIPTGPLASGFLTGKYKPDLAPPADSSGARNPEAWERRLTERNFKIIQALEGWAKDHGHSVLDLAFAWVAAQPQVVSIIAGARNEEQVTQNAAATQWKLTPAQADEVAKVAAQFDSSVLPGDENDSLPGPRERG